MKSNQSIKSLLIVMLSLITCGCFPYMGELYKAPMITGSDCIITLGIGWLAYISRKEKEIFQRIKIRIGEKRL